MRLVNLPSATGAEWWFNPEHVSAVGHTGAAGALTQVFCAGDDDPWSTTLTVEETVRLLTEDPRAADTAGQET